MASVKESSPAAVAQTAPVRSDQVENEPDRPPDSVQIVISMNPMPPSSPSTLPPVNGSDAPVKIAVRSDDDACSRAAEASGEGKPIEGEVVEKREEKGGEKGVVIDLKRSSGEAAAAEFEGEKVCRICHLSPDLDGGTPERSELIQIGCGCKDELGTAHRYCAEAWFRVKGNRYCEICGLNAKNIKGEDDSRFMDTWNGRRTVASGNGRNSAERTSCWRGQPFCNFLMACLVIAFILPWFFRVNMF